MWIFALLILAGSIGMALWPERRVAEVEQRIAEGDDRYFEEQRSYAAYPKMRDPRHIRRIGWFGIVGALAMLALWWFGTP